jgi:recombination protein RecR
MLDNLIKIISTLPSLGPRSAKRIVLHLMKNNAQLMNSVGHLMQDVSEKVKNCTVCGNLDVSNPCKICSSYSRNKNILCVVEEVADLWNIEESGHYNGVYHVVGGAISAANSVMPEDLNLESLFEKVKNAKIEEIILANNPTANGQTTAFYISKKIEEIVKQNNLQTTVTSLAKGVPIGSEIDYLDESTIGAAFSGRKAV